MQAVVASTLVAGSVMLAICVARGTLELLFWGCRVARPQLQQPVRPGTAPPSENSLSRRN